VDLANAAVIPLISLTGEVAAKLIAKVKQSGSFGYTSVLPENGIG
jgi:hypothetical protein